MGGNLEYQMVSDFRIGTSARRHAGTLFRNAAVAGCNHGDSGGVSRIASPGVSAAGVYCRLPRNRLLYQYLKETGTPKLV